MPGKVIGTELNPVSEVVWSARIMIRKTLRTHEVEYQFEEGDSAISKLVHDHLRGIVQELNKAS